MRTKEMPFWKTKQQPDLPDLDTLVKVQGSRSLASKSGDTTRPPDILKPGRTWEPHSLTRGMSSRSLQTSDDGGFHYSGNHRAAFYRHLRDNIPIISTAVSTWVNLCSTALSRTYYGSDLAQKKAAETLHLFEYRVLEMIYGRGSGLHKLINALYLELFTVGRFCGQAVLTEDGKQVDHFAWIDPDRVVWEHGEAGWIPFVADEEDNLHRIEPELFFQSVLSTDLTNPAGVEPLASIPFVSEIEQQMLEDMARSSHNSGTPRFQIKINRPEQGTHEDSRKYIDRANGYFRSVVAEFQNLEPDQNIFTWQDVEITMMGGGHDWNWRLNREQVIEDVITGMKLYPWVLGRTHRSTQNWTQSQFDLLMHMTSVYQRCGIDLADWLCNLELRLQDIKAAVRHEFARHPDPFLKERLEAEKIRLANIDLKVQRGYISKDEGAREMGYEGAHFADAPM
ncbi:hypothetical protein ACFLQV_01430 [Calditrichota bacterium]